MNTIRFTNEAKNWNEAFPIGNGFIGAMVFGGTSIERIQVNEDSLWSGGNMNRINPDAKEYIPQIRTLLKEDKIE
ncbi:glycoside hydrolase N-terminal domain-containing protein, partial [Paenibacillus sp. HN-1]